MATYFSSIVKKEFERHLKDGGEDWYLNYCESQKVTELPGALYEQARKDWTYPVPLKGRHTAYLPEKDGKICVYLPPKITAEVDQQAVDEAEMLFDLYCRSGDKGFSKAFSLHNTINGRPMVNASKGQSCYIFNGIDWEEYIRIEGEGLRPNGARASFRQVFLNTDFHDRLKQVLPRGRGAYIRTLKLSKKKHNEGSYLKEFKFHLRTLQSRRYGKTPTILYEGSNCRSGPGTYFEEGSDGQIVYLWQGPRGVIKTLGPKVNAVYNAADVELRTLKGQIGALVKTFKFGWTPVLFDTYSDEMHIEGAPDSVDGLLSNEEVPVRPKDVRIGEGKIKAVLEERVGQIRPFPGLGTDFDDYQFWAESLWDLARSENYVNGNVLNKEALKPALKEKASVFDLMKQALKKSSPE